MNSNSPTLGILQCDTVMTQFQSSFGNYPLMLTKLFHRIEPEMNIHVYNVQNGQYPPNINACDAYITTGSKASVYDKADWIKNLEHYIRTLHQVKKKLIGICFGHQLIAQALGGKTEPAPQGWGVGVHNYSITNRPSWLSPEKKSFNLIVSHKDQVVQLPENATVIAGSRFCPYAAFYIGQHIFTTQGHPEFSKEYSAALMQYRRETLGSNLYQTGLDSLERPTDEIAFTHWMINFMKINWRPERMNAQERE